MKISELIQRLERLQEQHGDLPVWCLVPGYDNSEEQEELTDKLIDYESPDKFNPSERIMIGEEG